MPKYFCNKCQDKGWIETGNDDLFCSCPAGGEVVLNGPHGPEKRAKSYFAYENSAKQVKDFDGESNTTYQIKKLNSQDRLVKVLNDINKTLGDILQAIRNK